MGTKTWLSRVWYWANDVNNEQYMKNVEIRNNETNQWRRNLLTEDIEQEDYHRIRTDSNLIGNISSH